MTKDAIRIKLRKRITPDHQDLNNSDNFYPDNNGNKFFAIGHFTDIFIDRISNEMFYEKKQSKSPLPQKIKSQINILLKI